MHTPDTSLPRDIVALHWIARFSWLRTAELGQLLWPSQRSYRQAADRLARELIHGQHVIVRELPAGAGRVLMLSAVGVRALMMHGIRAKTGKDIGTLTQAGWQPPATWRHDLIAHGVLCELHRRGFAIYPEAELRRAITQRKIPDGLAVKGTTVIWLEVEQARKSGASMRQLVHALKLAALGQAEPIMGQLPTHVMVAYCPESKDERGHALHHDQRVRHALETWSVTDIPLYWARCTLLGTAGVGTIEIRNETIIADHSRRVGKVLAASGWRTDEDNCLTSNYGPYQVYVWEDDNSWGWEVTKDGVTMDGDPAENLSAAKQAAAARIARETTPTPRGS